MADKKSALAEAFGAPDAEADPMPDEGGGDGFDQACDEMMAALKANDKAGFCEALKAAIDIHTSGGGAEEEEPK